MGFLQNEKFRSNGCLLKSEHFQPSHTNPFHSETFLQKITHRFRLFFRSKAVHYFICSLSNSFCAVTFVNNNAAYKINRNKHENTLRVLFSDIFSYITTESGFTHQIRTDCLRSITEIGQTAAEKPQHDGDARICFSSFRYAPLRKTNSIQSIFRYYSAIKNPVKKPFGKT